MPRLSKEQERGLALRRVIAAGGEADLVPDEAHAEPGAPQRRVPMHTAKRIQRQEAFLAAYREAGVEALACRVAGISKGLVRLWRLVPEFEDAYREAQDEATDSLEAEAIRRARDGVDEPVIFQGMPTMIEREDGTRVALTTKKYSDGLMLALLKAKRPDEYRENVKVDATVSGGVLVVPAPVSRDAWAAAAEEHQGGLRVAGDSRAIEQGDR